MKRFELLQPYYILKSAQRLIISFRRGDIIPGSEGMACIITYGISTFRLRRVENISYLFKGITQVGSLAGGGFKQDDHVRRLRHRDGAGEIFDEPL